MPFENVEADDVQCYGWWFGAGNLFHPTVMGQRASDPVQLSDVRVLVHHCDRIHQFRDLLSFRSAQE